MAEDRSSPTPDTVILDEPTLAKIVSKIQSLYDEGVPLFTRESIRDVYEQLKESNGSGRQISVRALDGTIVKYTLNVGSVCPGPEPHIEWVSETCRIHYQSIQSLTSPFFSTILVCECPSFLLCSMPISHPVSSRNIVTKEIISPFVVQPLEDVEVLFQKCMDAWRASQSWKQLRATLESIAPLLRRPQLLSSDSRKNSTTKSQRTIDKVIGLACGNISLRHRTSTSDDSGSSLARRCATQHALLLTMREVLDDVVSSNDCRDGGSEPTSTRPRPTTLSEIKCYVQDPAYNDVDKTVLTGAGFTILQDPEAFLEIDDSTVLFSCAPNVPVRQIVAELARPAIMVWDRVKEDTEEDKICGVRATDPDSPRLRRMIREFYDEFEFPRDPENFVDLAVYVRKPTVPSD
ncbi:hypothetical protein VTO42DRAFT_6335 [Malbranchea cinnamomea]